MFHFGFSYIGLIWLLMLFVPNIIWTKGCGHTPQADKPEEVANIIAELNK